MKWDVFISHASEDKNEIARPLACLLRDNGVKVWLDEQELCLGDSLRQKIDEGLAQSCWGIVILSPSFFSKEWPQTELDALLTRELGGHHLILPVWHHVSSQDVAEISPILASRLAIDTSKGLDAVCRAILCAVERGEVKNFTDDNAGDGCRKYDRRNRSIQNSKLPSRPFVDLERLWFQTSIDDLCGILEGNRGPFGRIGQYFIKDFIGIGGTGAVFRASHVLIGTIVAFKLFFPLRHEFDVVSSVTLRAVRALGSLRHEGVASLLDFGTLSVERGRTVYLVYEFVDGKPLDRWSRDIANDAQSLGRRLAVATAITKTLSACHAHKFVGNSGFQEIGILHGDIKPGNVLISVDEDKPVLLDFMIPDIQRLIEFSRHRPSFWTKGESGQYRWDQPATAVFGTPGYMPPEQEIDGIVQPSSDVYSLGKTFSHLFWPLVDPADLYVERLTGTNIKEKTHVEKSIKALINAMTAAAPDDRIQGMNEVIEQLEGLKERLGKPS